MAHGAAGSPAKILREEGEGTDSGPSRSVRRGRKGDSRAWERRLTRGAQLAGGAACWAEARTCAGEAVLFVGCGPLSENGPRGKRLGWFVCWAARRERKGAGLGFLGFFSILFPLSYLFLNQTKFEFKYKFEFKPHSNN